MDRERAKAIEANALRMLDVAAAATTRASKMEAERDELRARITELAAVLLNIAEIASSGGDGAFGPTSRIESIARANAARAEATARGNAK